MHWWRPQDPQLDDVRDESSEEVRIVLELQARRVGPRSPICSSTAPLRWAYVNLCLIPPEVPGGVCTPVPASLDLILRKWLDFRYATVRRNFEYELRSSASESTSSGSRHFADLDAAIRIIRSSEGKRDTERLMDHFDLDDVQVEKVLELQLYRLAKLPISEILELEQSAKMQHVSRPSSSSRELWAWCVASCSTSARCTAAPAAPESASTSPSWNSTKAPTCQ